MKKNIGRAMPVAVTSSRSKTHTTDGFTKHSYVDI